MWLNISAVECVSKRYQNLKDIGILLFVISEMRKQPGCPLTTEFEQSGMCFQWKEDIMQYSTAWMKLEERNKPAMEREILYGST